MPLSKDCLRRLNVKELVDLTSAPSFAGQREMMLGELKRKSRTVDLPPRAFRLVYPEHEEICVGQMGGWGDADSPHYGFRGVPLYRYIARDEDGNEVQSTQFI